MAKALLDWEMMVVVVVAECLNFKWEVGFWFEPEEEGLERDLLVRRPRRKKKVLM
jgi:hypothetical protein